MSFVTDKLLQLVSIEGFAERLLTYEGSVEERLSPINKPREYLTFEKATISILSETTSERSSRNRSFFSSRILIR